MRAIVSILFCCLFFSAFSQKREREGYARTSHKKETLVLLNRFIKALQIPKLNPAKRTCKPYMTEDETKISEISFEKAHRHAIHFKYPVLLTEIRQINIDNKNQIEYKIWIGLNRGMGVRPPSVNIIFPKDGSLPKVTNVNNL